jgi:hypothetical protein
MLPSLRGRSLFLPKAIPLNDMEIASQERRPRNDEINYG